MMGGDDTPSLIVQTSALPADWDERIGAFLADAGPAIFVLNSQDSRTVYQAYKNGATHALTEPDQLGEIAYILALPREKPEPRDDQEGMSSF
jgi:hypothetical protein